MKMLYKIVVAAVISLNCISANAQDTLSYTGNTLSRIDYHHGQLRPAIGTHAQQIMRANRSMPEESDGFGWTYNHAPMIAYWKGTFFVNYLNNPVGEHIPPSQTFLLRSTDGKDWDFPEVLFPIYDIPDGYQKEGHDGVAEDLQAVMHQRMGFYVSSSDRLLALGYYGIAMDAKDSPNDGKGIGRVVREIYEDGTFGPIHFIRYNSSWDRSLSKYPYYEESGDEGFVAACEELMDEPLMMQQWVEEADRDDPLIPLQKQFKAFSYYHLEDGSVVGLWKHALTSLSKDGGKTWEYDPVRAPGVVNSNAKIWGQRTSDDRFALVYNPSEYRWPLAISTSDDGLEYEDLLLLHGEISAMRYGGNYKSYGPQYVRGILEGNGTPPDGKLWVTYSVNKEDIWVASSPVPITDQAPGHANEVFGELEGENALQNWNTYSLVWGPVGIEEWKGEKVLALRDKDPFDYAKAERVIPRSEKLTVSLEVEAGQNDHGQFQIEFQDGKGRPAVQLLFGEDGLIRYRAGYRLGSFGSYEPGKSYKLEVELDVATRSYDVKINGQEKGRRIFFAPVDAIERVMFRTGTQRYFPTPETPTNQDYDLEGAGSMDQEAAYFIRSLVSKSL
ncbi:exo-alpha-sialidase [Pleomorphovibrio marinus]|uniref:exo-alpha-sialidase n=1 Tax=Pleomorphovibrio marinus TaxID=2164132 RepID=UPI000E0B2DDA|nr:exo-alpha-sialidase [Pleomorphovibrio marinus]